VVEVSQWWRGKVDKETEDRQNESTKAGSGGRGRAGKRAIINACVD
jgi:hypothetical protein